ncbi:LRMP protein, partial [Spelaeornis formosus]|nr:LRMP protein [Elachura formosa]
RHHNPVDSICRKIKSIQMMDQVSNPGLQIPKFQSRNFDSLQSNTKKYLEEILKGRTCRSWRSSHSPLVSPDSDSILSANLPGLGDTS